MADKGVKRVPVRMASSSVREAIGWLTVELQHLCGTEDPVREIVLGPETYDALIRERSGSGTDAEMEAGTTEITPPMPNGRLLKVRRARDT